MAKTDFKSVDEYISSQAEASRPVLEQVRCAIRKALPDADEVISYQIPAYKVKGGAAIYFGGWKTHFSLYPISERVVAAFRQELAGHEISKGTVRFPLSKPVPEELIGRIAQFRAREVAELQKSNAAARKR
jgi:uncharacterized protein YdhG (YjbR/CyaY superfamily)